MVPIEADGSERPLQPLVSELASDAELAELLELFVTELDARIRLLDLALRQGDVETLESISHRLRGSATGYGFPTITDSAADLEDAILAGEQEVSALAEKVEALIHLCRRASISPA